MIQRQQPHPAGTFPACRACGAEPRHIVAHGASNREQAIDLPPDGIRHQLECRCGEHTGWRPQLADAESHWRLHFANQAATARRSTVRPLLRLHQDRG